MLQGAALVGGHSVPIAADLSLRNLTARQIKFGFYQTTGLV